MPVCRSRATPMSYPNLLCFQGEPPHFSSIVVFPSSLFTPSLLPTEFVISFFLPPNPETPTPTSRWTGDLIHSPHTGF